MNSEDRNPQPNFSRQIIGILVVMIAFLWVGFAYFKGSKTENSDGETLLILHPIIALFLIIFLIYTKRLIQVHSVINLLITAIAIWIFLQMSSVLMPFIFGLGLAYFIRFIFRSLEDVPLPFGLHLRVPRFVVRLILIGATISLIAVLTFYIIPNVVEQSRQMTIGLAKFYKETLTPFILGDDTQEGLIKELANISGGETARLIEDYLKERIPTLAQTGSDLATDLIKKFSSIALGFGGFLTTAFLAIMVSIYASQSLGSYANAFIDLFPTEKRDHVRAYLIEIDRNMTAFLRGQVIVIGIISIISMIAYSVIGVPFALLVGLLAGLSNAIPTLGPFIGGAFALLSMLIGFAAGSFDLIGLGVRTVALLGAIVGIQMIDNSLISPKIMSEAVDVDPLMIMFGVVIGATLIGFWGVLLSIPIIVIVKSIITVVKRN